MSFVLKKQLTSYTQLWIISQYSAMENEVFQVTKIWDNNYMIEKIEYLLCITQ